MTGFLDQIGNDGGVIASTDKMWKVPEIKG
jgi:hypothetical protein